jgi:hypothetical protein
MKGVRVFAITVSVGILGLGGWWLFGQNRGTGALSAQAAHLVVRWSGKYQGIMTLPAKLNWCPGTRRGILEAISGDSGVAVVLYERDSLTSGPHAVISPDMAVSIPAPGATVVMRWMRADRDTALAGFRSQGGTVRINVGGGEASGDINARMRALPGNDTLIVQGVFRGVPVVTTAAGCS